MPSLGIAPRSGSCLGRAGIPRQSTASVSGVFPTDGILRLLEIRLQAIQLSPCRAGPSTHRSLRLDTTVDLLSCSRSLILSEPGKTSDPETSSQVSPDYIGNTTERLVAQRPLSTRFEPAPRLRDFNHWFTVVAPSGLACRTRTVWQYRSVPSLSGPLATIPGVPRIRLPPASIGPLRRTNGGGLPPPLDYLAPRGAPPSRGTRSSPDRQDIPRPVSH
jgi:hypothetical protein